ncbi:MAG: MgtC/SapB family protein [bacterium JZ-2024 1]
MELLEGIGKLVLSVLLGGLLGYERKRMGKPAGARTHALVAAGSCLFALASLWAAEQFPNVDATRIASQVVVGIGFIGAGAIIRYGALVKGLTTAATLWISAALGLTTGMGLYLYALTAFLLVFLVLQFTPLLERFFLPRAYIPVSVKILSEDSPATQVHIHRLLEDHHIVIEDHDFEPVGSNLVKLELELLLPPGVPVEDLVQRLEKMEHIHWVKSSSPAKKK